MPRDTTAGWIALEAPLVIGDCTFSHQVWSGSGLRIALVESHNCGPELAAEHARLIAAAPELLAGLKVMVDQVGDLFDPDWLEDVKAVIAKAEGLA